MADRFTLIYGELNEIKKELNRQLKLFKETFIGIEEEIRLTEQYIRELEGDIGHYLQIIRDPQLLASRAFSGSLAEYSVHAFYILREEALKACQNSTEFNSPFFIESLQKVVEYSRDSKDAIEIEYDSDNYSIESVQIDFNSIAGKLEDYVNAVKKVREEQGWGKTKGKKGRTGRSLFELASHLWREKIYKVDREGATVTKRKVVQRKSKNQKRVTTTIDVTARYKGKYWRTMELRQKEWGTKLAPWWEILDKGNLGTTFKDVGHPYPNVKGQNFIAKAKKRIKEEFNDFFNNRRYRDRETLLRLIKKAQERQKVLRKYIEDLKRLDAPGIGYDEPTLNKIKKTSDLLKAQREKYNATPLAKADPEKVRNLINRLIAGERPGRIRLGRGVQIRTAQIAKLLEEEFAKFK